MNLPIVAQIPHELYTPSGEDEIGLATDAWTSTAPVDSHGWYPPSADTVGLEPGRRPVDCDMVLMVPLGTVCGDRDRWTLPDGTYAQQGRAEDYSHGPFGMTVPLLVYLKRVEG